METYLAIEKEVRTSSIVLREEEFGSFRMSYVGMEARGWVMQMLIRGLDAFMVKARKGAAETWSFEMV